MFWIFFINLETFYQACAGKVNISTLMVFRNQRRKKTTDEVGKVLCKFEDKILSCKHTLIVKPCHLEFEYVTPIDNSK